MMEGFIKKTGMYQNCLTELMLDNQVQMIFLPQRGYLQVQLSYSGTQERMRGGSPVVINNVNNSQNNPVISNQNYNYEST